MKNDIYLNNNNSNNDNVNNQNQNVIHNIEINNGISNDKNDLEEIKLEVEKPKVKNLYPLECIDNINNLCFLFVNPRSGSEEGKIFFKLAEKHNCSKHAAENLKLIHLEDKVSDCYTYMFNVIDANDVDLGCYLISEYISTITKENELKIKVLVAGGDGTVLSLIESFHNKNINLAYLIFGHIPLGTGNDLSNALGFGCEIKIDSSLSSFAKVIMRYHRARHSKVDVWELKLNVNKEGGEIIEIKQDSKTPKMDKEGKPIMEYQRSFINYFSLGYDARVGFGFEKSRSSSRCWNKCIYFWEGIKKNCCRKTMPLSSFLSSFQVMPNENYFKSPSDEIDNNNNNTKENKRFSILSCKKNFNVNNKQKSFDFGSQKDKFKEVVLKGNPVSLVCQNINYYMGGTKDIWRKSGRNIGLEVFDGDVKNKQETKTFELLLENSSQSYNDQKLEFFVYSSGLKIGIEKIATGQADKIYHGAGPIYIEFLDTPERVN